MSVSFEVYNDFLNYKGGVYIHTGLNSKFNPFHITNHAVLLVGYGKINIQQYTIIQIEHIVYSI